jgi:hypothetical protein
MRVTALVGHAEPLDYATNRELEVRAIKLLFRHDQCYVFVNMSRDICSDNKEAGFENSS